MGMEAWCAFLSGLVCLVCPGCVEYIGLLQNFLLCVRSVALIASFAFWLKSGYLLLLITFHLAVICNTMDLCADALDILNTWDAARTSFRLSSAIDPIVAPSQENAAPEGHGATIASERHVRRASLADSFWFSAESLAEAEQERADELQQTKADIESRIIADAPRTDTKRSLVLVGMRKSKIRKQKVDSKQEEKELDEYKYDLTSTGEEHQTRMDNDLDEEWERHCERWARERVGDSSQSIKRK